MLINNICIFNFYMSASLGKKTWLCKPGGYRRRQTTCIPFSECKDKFLEVKTWKQLGTINGSFNLLNSWWRGQSLFPSLSETVNFAVVHETKYHLPNVKRVAMMLQFWSGKGLRGSSGQGVFKLWSFSALEIDIQLSKRSEVTSFFSKFPSSKFSWEPNGLWFPFAKLGF